MFKPSRFTTAASLVALASVIAGCAAPQTRVETSGFGGKANGEVGLATRALAALAANQPTAAIGFAERAVERTPDDAGFRAILGNAYFAAGRFASAEAAYRDALAIYPAQPQVGLKLVLAQIGQGKQAEALSQLDANRDQLDAADFGLALALAGRPADAVPMLETAAREPHADSRVRQNLALAHALSGDWSRARLIASQDVTPDKLDARIEQWMQLARPAKSSDQLAALTGIVPAASDPGQPVRLALQRTDTQVAEAAPAPTPQAAIAELPPLPLPVEAAPAPQFAEAAPPPPPPPVEPIIEAPVPAPSTIARMAAAVAEAPAAIAAALAPEPFVKVNRASVTTKLPPVRNGALRAGKSKAVLQLGAYRSPQHVTAAWATLTQRYPALRAHLPLRARFDSPKGTFYRLSIQGFASQQQAIARCSALKSRGGSCFVRTVAGDAPIQLASR